MTTTIQTIQLDSELERSANLSSSVTMGATPSQLVTSDYWVANVPASNALFNIGKTLESSQQIVELKLTDANGPRTLRTLKEMQTSSATMRIAERKIESLINDLIELMAEAFEEDAGVPTGYALRNAIEILPSAYTVARLRGPEEYNSIPPATLATDEVGGLRLYWQVGRRQIRVNFGASPDRRSYVYFQDRERHGVDPLDAEALAERLQWLMLNQ
jgi:hypothetical protein